MFNGLKKRAEKLSYVDIKLIKWAVFFATIIIVKIFPQLLQINYWILGALVILCSAKPFYNFWIKK